MQFQRYEYTLFIYSHGSWTVEGARIGALSSHLLKHIREEYLPEGWRIHTLSEIQCLLERVGPMHD